MVAPATSKTTREELEADESVTETADESSRQVAEVPSTPGVVPDVVLRPVKTVRDRLTEITRNLEIVSKESRVREETTTSAATRVERQRELIEHESVALRDVPERRSIESISPIESLAVTTPTSGGPVEVTIGRIEIHAAPERAATPARPPRTPAKGVSLDEFLERRGRGR
jgi:hypothetical protein